jgi:NAD(P)-dependent dehydrogenase (short-subunit alcohol dehydrogenase family)
MATERKVALITGAASGIGRAGAKLFASRGMRIAAVDVDQAALSRVVDEIRTEGGEASGITADLSQAQQAESVMRRVTDLFGGVDIVWNNAGISGPPDREGFSRERFEETLDINLTAAVVTASAAIPSMRERGGGALIFTSSTSGLVGSPAYSAYTCTKFALIGYTKSMAQQLAPYRIRVNAICPGPVRTPMIDKISGANGKEYQAWLVTAVPLGRPAEPIEIAHAAYWLASDESSYVTGIALPVDGGYTCR